MEKLVQDLEIEVALMKEEAAKFDRGNKTAGKRVRKSAQAVKKLAQEIRLKVQEVKNAGKE